MINKLQGGKTEDTKIYSRTEKLPAEPAIKQMFRKYHEK